ncbi:MAG: hypothetical protein UV73_C0002G0167 [Candidatus Gottesmanbacteria bacterium GW2011_GWA2_43_14]|uniref:Uncharacterized protein n=1 Tax=Candidatus Gottesmanbacteria bacterium GW2011_GWA2_43_14 TaxID=1618443 RepID=A0A0G1GI33_9BACT|nr:MAG: hypothetical protein UV73_C0002G0167 [Candidatus Gottesmanbacteria bacterium GW2011_GWA2_43_14]
MTILVSFYKYNTSEKHYINVKVKAGQGLWWYSGNNPKIWMLNSLNKDILNNPQIALKSIRYYPINPESNNNTDSFDIFIIARISVIKDGNQYTYRRNPVNVGAPIDMRFNNIMATGTVIDMNEKEIDDDLHSINVSIIKHNPFPYEMESLSGGTIYFDGMENTLEVKEKLITTNSFNGSNQTLSVNMKLKVKKIRNFYVFGNERIISVGNKFTFITPSFTFSDWVITKVENTT